MSGIFRDVYILKRPENAIRDYRITTQLETEKATVNIQVEYTKNIETNIILEDKNGAIIATGSIRENGSVKLDVVCPILWNTENPYLYTLILKTENETIVEYVGFRTIEIVNKVILFNGQKIKFRGVNRHDSDPVTGFTVGIDQKGFNVDEAA